MNRKRPEFVRLSLGVSEDVAASLGRIAQHEDRSVGAVARIVLEGVVRSGVLEAGSVEGLRDLLERPVEERPRVLDRRGLVAVPNPGE